VVDPTPSQFPRDLRKCVGLLWGAIADARGSLERLARAPFTSKVGKAALERLADAERTVKRLQALAELGVVALDEGVTQSDRHVTVDGLVPRDVWDRAEAARDEVQYDADEEDLT
jgi:hypothetical protein